MQLSKEFEDCDHAAWRVPEHRWDNIEGFVSATTWTDGIHSIEVPDGPHIDLLINGLARVNEDASALPIFFNGAVTSRDSKKAPFFSGVRIAANGGFPYIAVSDPSLLLDKSLGLAWYAGNRHAAYQHLIEKLLSRIHDVTNHELLLVGGSGGGFASLYYGHKLGSRASVLVWNPQTDVLEYNQGFVKNYLAVALGEEGSSPDLSQSDWKETASTLAIESKVGLDLVSEREDLTPRRIIYLQNADDWHVVAHLVPYLTAFDYSYTGRGGYSRSENHQVWIAQFGAGHAPPSSDAVAKAIDLFRDPGRTAQEVVVEMRNTNIFDDQKSELLPRDLRFLSERLRELLTFEARMTGGDLVLRVDSGIVPYGYGGLSIEFSEILNGVPRVLRSFESGFEFVSREAQRNETTRRFRVAFRDGFGNRLFGLDSNLIHSEPHRLVIYGSSTSAEAFNGQPDFEVLDYIARCSIGSAFQPRVETLFNSIEAKYSLDDAFLRRILDLDLCKCLPDALSDDAFDFLLIDMIDERIPLLKVNGSYITHSPELRRTGYRGALEDEVRPGSPEHLALCKVGISRLVDLVGAQKIVVNKLFWAVSNSAGEPLSQVREISEMNEMLTSIYNFWGEYEGVRFVEYPEEILLSEERHKWGAAPYRFGSAVHQHLLGCLTDIFTS